MLPIAGLLAIRRRPLECGEALGTYAGALAFAGTLSITLPLAASGSASLQAVGLHVGLALKALFCALTLILAGAVAVITGAVVRTHAAAGPAAGVRAGVALAG